MKKAILIIAVILTACNTKESATDAYIRKNNEEIAKSKAKMDSIDLELLKLGVKDGSTEGK
jgi:PBP1b-binding outer membrane lipoprotein LpoB